MKHVFTYTEWSAINELRVLGAPFKIQGLKGEEDNGWREVHREKITVGDHGEPKEIGHLSYGIANTPTHNRFIAIINIESIPISGFGSHQIMTVYQEEFESKKEAEEHLEQHWKTQEFKNVEIKRTKFPTIGYDSERSKSSPSHHQHQVEGK